jgi:hypothetical protein
VPHALSLLSSYSSRAATVDDLKHMTAVRPESHNKFAQENEMASFLMSAKNGDQVNKAFWKISSTLAGQTLAPCSCCPHHCPLGPVAIGVSINKSDLDSKGIVVPAQIIDHQRLHSLLLPLSPIPALLLSLSHDPNVNQGQVPEYTKRTGCLIS